MLKSIYKKRILLTLKVIGVLILFIWSIWAIGASYYTFDWSGAFKIIGTVLLAIILLSFPIIGIFKKMFWALSLILLVAISVYFANINPEILNSKDYQTPWAVKAQVEKIDFDKYLIKDIRDFSYRSTEDYDVRYCNQVIDLEKVTSISLALSHWDGLEKVAHSMLSFGFSDGNNLVLSAETRLLKSSIQGFIPGMYKQYEVMNILGTESDLFRLRTEFRGEELYLYRTNATKEQAKELLKMVLERTQKLYNKPEFYNSITDNCTTSLKPLLLSVMPNFEGDIRLLLNGKSDEMLFEFGYLKHKENETFEELKKRSLITPKKNRPEKNYSQIIRENNTTLNSEK